jgi:hypothetical protein
MQSVRLIRSSMICAGLFGSLLCMGPAMAKGGHHGHRGARPFKLTGIVQTSPSPCGSDVCFDLTASLKYTQGDSFDFTGSGKIDESKCHPRAGGSCCQTTETGQVSDTSGDSVDEGFVGTDCTNGSTQETLKGSLTITGGTGRFSGAKGSGKLFASINTSTDSGPITLFGKISK